LEKLVWRVKLVAEAGGGEAAREIEVARIERAPHVRPETLGLSLEEGKRIAAAVQREMVRGQASVMGDQFRYCGHCRAALPSKGYRSITFRSYSAMFRCAFGASSVAYVLLDEKDQKPSQRWRLKAAWRLSLPT
jgi:hypothetical protein